MNVYWLFMVLHHLQLSLRSWNFGEQQVRVRYYDNPYGVFGWHVEVRGQGLLFWTCYDGMPYQDRDRAVEVAYELAKRTGGYILWK